MYDVIIIGSGPAGLSAALYASRGGMKTLVIEKLGCGGQAALTYEVDNYPGVTNSPSGLELAENMKAHAKKFGAEFTMENVKAIDNINSRIKTVVTRKNSYETKAVILAMGSSARTLGVDGEEQFKGLGVSYCAYCDGAFCSGKDAVVVGGGNTAFEDALYLSRFCENVAIIHRSDTFKAEKNLVDKARANEKIILITDTVVEKILGSSAVNSVLVKNVKSGKAMEIETSAVFIAIGTKPQSELVKGFAELDKNSFIKTDANMRTSIDGVFAAGDVRDTVLRQIITAAADGAVAATSAVHYVNNEFNS